MDDKFRMTRTSALIFVSMLCACGGGSGGGAPTEPPSSGTAPSSSGTEPSLASAGAPIPGTVEFFATFPNVGQFRTNPEPVEGMSDDGVWWVEQKAPGRAVVVDIGRDGGSGLRLHTEPGDDFVAGSDTHERNDVALQDTDGVQGREHWWAHSVFFPADYVVPPSGSGSRGVVFDFHYTRNQGGQANFHIFVEPGGRMTFRGHGGPTAVMSDAGNEYSYGADIGPLEKNIWYDFVYHVKWSSNSDGFFQAWVNGVLKLDHRGPTLYQGYGVILKLANYHSAFGQGSSVIHDRVIRGTTWQVVSLTPLEGVSP
jgi:hypothetical protein